MYMLRYKYLVPASSLTYYLPTAFFYIDEALNEFNLTLYDGWNLISFPLRPFNSSVDSIFDHPLIEDYEVYTWIQ